MQNKENSDNTGRKKHSIFLKLAIVITVAGLLIGCAFILFMRFHFSSRVNTQFSKSVENYYHYLAEDIGSPPDTILAKNISDKYLIGIKYENDPYSWEYGNTNYERSDEIRHWAQILIGFWYNDPLIINNADGSRFIFSADFHRIINPNPYELFIFLFGLIVILCFSYWVIRNILKPVKRLSKGVGEVAKGNLNYKVPLTSNDELTMLCDSFNQMTKRINEMIRARNQLLIDVSHELRSPLTRIKVALQLVEDNPALLEKNKDRISSDIKELEAMITELLESERMDGEFGKLELKSFNIKEMAEEVMASFDDKKITLNIPDDLFLSVDSERMKLVLKNLIGNAIKFSGGENKYVHISAEEQNDKILLKIKDEGMGIPESELPYIFEPFYKINKARTKKSSPGSNISDGYGLGLSLCKKIVEAHNGKISIANNNGSGVTVTIELPKV